MAGELKPLGRIIFKIVWALFLLFLLGLRWWIQWGRTRTVATVAADICILLAWVVLAIGTGMMVLEDVLYLRWDNTPEDDRTLFKHPFFALESRYIHFYGVFVYYVCLFLSKGAFVAVYYSLIERMSIKKFSIALHCVTAWTIAGFMASMLFNIFWCRPISINWNNPSQCMIMNTTASLAVSYVTNVATSIPIILFPIFIIHSLNFNRRERIAFIFTTVIGSLTIMASTARLIQREIFANAEKKKAHGLDEWGSIIRNVEDWSFAEAWVALLAFCLPAYRAFLRSKSRKGTQNASQAIMESLLESAARPGQNPAAVTTYISAEPGRDTKGAQPVGISRSFSTTSKRTRVDQWQPQAHEMHSYVYQPPRNTRRGSIGMAISGDPSLSGPYDGGYPPRSYFH